MNNHDQRKHLINPTRVAVALCALAALGGRAAQAQVTFLTDPSQLGNNVVRTVPYPTGSAAGIVPQTFSVPTTSGSSTVSFTATMAPTPTAGFESFIPDATIAPQFLLPLPPLPAAFQNMFDPVEDTTNVTSGGSFPTAPLLINFQNSLGLPSGVGGFGLYAQDFNSDMETFTLNLFAGPNATLPLGSLTYATADNTSSSGTAVFVGAETTLGLPLIESATLSSLSFAAGSAGNPNNGSNDFYFGPTRVLAPVPEASTVVSFGMGVLLFAGLALGARRRKVSGKSAA